MNLIMENQLSISKEFLAKINEMPVLNTVTFANLQKQTRDQPQILHEIFMSFFEDVNEMISGLTIAINNQDFHNYKATLHTLKGLSGTIGATRMHEVTTFLYTQARNDDFSYASAGIPLLHQSIMDLEEELEGKF